MNAFSGTMAMPSAAEPPSLQTTLARSPFGVVIPGFSVCFEFQALDSTHWVAAIGNAPKSFVVFLTQTEPLPTGYGIELYLAQEMDASGGFVYVGAITTHFPSALIETPNIFLNVNEPVRVVLGLALGSEGNILNMSQSVKPELEKSQKTTKITLAERIVEDLCNFVSSYARGVKAGELIAPAMDAEEYVLMPISFVTKWRERVLTKLNKDASFWN